MSLPVRETVVEDGGESPISPGENLAERERG